MRGSTFLPALPDPDSFAGRCRAAGMAPSTVRNRMKRSGMTFEQARAAERVAPVPPKDKPRTRAVGGAFKGGKAELSPGQYFVDALRGVLGKDPLYGVRPDDPRWTAWGGLDPGTRQVRALPGAQ